MMHRIESAPLGSADAIVTINNLTVRFGGIVALENVSFSVARDEICGIIGPNGAGKTTLFNCLSRLNSYASDAIAFEGNALAHLPPWQMAPLGIGRTFQNLALFDSLSVVENIMLGAHSRAQGGILGNILRTPSATKEGHRLREEAWELACSVGLEAFGNVKASELPFGFQKRIELARAIAARPKLLLLDEPAAGLIHDEVEALGDLVLDLKKKLRLTVLIIEHHMGFIMKLCERIVVLNFGRKIADGLPKEVQENKAVLEAYLGAGVE